MIKYRVEMKDINGKFVKGFTGLVNKDGKILLDVDAATTVKIEWTEEWTEWEEVAHGNNSNNESRPD